MHICYLLIHILYSRSESRVSTQCKTRTSASHCQSVSEFVLTTELQIHSVCLDFAMSPCGKPSTDLSYFSHNMTELISAPRQNKRKVLGLRDSCTISPNSITSICCRFVVQQVIQQIEVMDLGCSGQLRYAAHSTSVSPPASFVFTYTERNRCFLAKMYYLFNYLIS